MIIYRTTNLLNGKTYIGLDTRNIPSYYGSGVYLKSAIDKYGKENFKKETLESGFVSMEDLFKAEVKYIALERQNNPNGTYNVSDGGLIGMNYTNRTYEEIFGNEKSTRIKNKISNTNKSKGIRPPSRLGSVGSEKQRRAVSIASTGRPIPEKVKMDFISRFVLPKSIVCVQTGKHYSSIKEAAKDLSLSSGNICSVLKGKRKHTNNFTFIYLDK